jgi:hypothetical protein
LPFDSLPLPARSADAPDLAGVATALRGLDRRHPYLLFGGGDVEELRRRAAACPELAVRCARVLMQAEATGDPRMALKRCGRRLITLAFAALCGEPAGRTAALAAARAALQETVAAASWSARPFIKSLLDRAEIGIAVALAYDWLYEALPPTERRAVEVALRRQILRPAVSAYGDPAAVWARRRSNCAIVSHAAVLICALAVAGPLPHLATRLVPQSVAGAWHAFSALAPDGAWPEGPSYWSLAVRHAALMIAALEAALGDSFGLAQRPGLAKTADFARHALGPFGAAFDFGDSTRGFDPLPFAWLAHRYGRPQDGWPVREYNGALLPLSLIWSPRPTADPQSLRLPTGKIFRDCDVACFRNTWSPAPEARPVYLAIKGGACLDPGADAWAPQNLTLHAQVDAGSFVIDGARQRWATDLGPDDYDLPGYFEHGDAKRPGRRWQYYRNQTAGHNTLVLNGRNQIAQARAPIVGGGVEGERQWVVFDLSAAYGKPKGSIRRGALLCGRHVVIQDEIAPGLDDTIVWTMHTGADPEFLGRGIATFRAGEDRLVVRILAPGGAGFDLAAPPPAGVFALGADEARHSGKAGAEVRELPRCDERNGKRGAGPPLRRLEIKWPTGARRLAVMLSPDSDGDEPPLSVTPLDQWLEEKLRPWPLACNAPCCSAGCC